MQRVIPILFVVNLQKRGFNNNSLPYGLSRHWYFLTSGHSDAQG